MAASSIPMAFWSLMQLAAFEQRVSIVRSPHRLSTTRALFQAFADAMIASRGIADAQVKWGGGQGRL